MSSETVNFDYKHEKVITFLQLSGKMLLLTYLEKQIYCINIGEVIFEDCLSGLNSKLFVTILAVKKIFLDRPTLLVGVPDDIQTFQLYTQNFLHGLNTLILKL